MKYVAAYALLVLGGKTDVSKAPSNSLHSENSD